VGRAKVITGFLDRLLGKSLRLAARFPRFERAMLRLDAEADAQSRALAAPAHIVTLQIVVAAACLTAIAWFFKERIGTYFNGPPDIYRQSSVYNLTTAGVTWDVYYGPPKMCGQIDCHLLPSEPAASYPYKMVLPAREFPLKNYKAGQIIYYRTWIDLPPNLRDQRDPLTFHSLYIWAETYDFYVNGALVESGARELLNIAIPRTLIGPDGKVFLAFRIDPGNLPYQGLAHRGDLVLGPKSKLAPTAFFAEERRTVFYLWFLLPKLAFCIMFTLLYFAVSKRSEIFFFCLFGFLGAADVFFSSGYAESMVPWVNGTQFELLSRNMASLTLMRFIYEFFRRNGARFRRVHGYGSLAVVATMVLCLLLLSEQRALNVLEALSALLKPLAMAFGAYLAFQAALYVTRIRGTNGRARVAAFLGVVFTAGLGVQIFESGRWIMDIMGKSGNMAGIYLYLFWIFDLILFVVLSAVIAGEFRTNLADKKRFKAELTSINERLELARSVQQMLMPRALESRVGDFEYKVFFDPAEKMSGDWFNIWTDDDGELRLFIGDVVGKGPSAALAVSVVASVFSECKRSGATLEGRIG
jgi:hypothetical protein